MKTYNKRQYRQDLADVAAKFQANRTAQIILVHAMDAAATCTVEQGDELNRLYDEEYNIEQERKEIERRWYTRNWTAAEYNTASLMANNVD